VGHKQHSDLKRLLRPQPYKKSNTVKKAFNVPSDFRAAIAANQNRGQNIAFLAVEMQNLLKDFS